jgi:hypothetical protein
VPLRLHLSDGRTVDILNPDVAVISNLSIYVFKVRRQGEHWADDTQLVSLRHVVSVEQVNSAQQRP